MQNKHVVMLHKNEDRDIFINKLKYPKTVYHVGDNPEPGDIHVDPKFGLQSCFAMWILDNYDNLPDYVIFSQAEPSDHVHEPLLAFDSTLTAKWGSFCYARSMYDQYSLDWTKINPIRTLAHKLGYGFHNDNNIRKVLYYFFPGEILYISKEKILEKPKSFYELIISIDIENKFVDYVNENYPAYVYRYLRILHPELNSFSSKEKITQLTTHHKRPHSYIGFSFEALWFILLADKDLFDLLDSSQACLGNKFYFNTNNEKYDPNFKFSKFPYSNNVHETKINFKLFENDWFDWECPYYLKWRETLVEKTIWEGEQKGFDGQELLNFYEKIGYKHISL
jgi:hypothetical protein